MKMFMGLGSLSRALALLASAAVAVIAVDLPPEEREDGDVFVTTDSREPTVVSVNQRGLAQPTLWECGSCTELAVFYSRT